MTHLDFEQLPTVKIYQQNYSIFQDLNGDFIPRLILWYDTQLTVSKNFSKTFSIK